MPTLLSIVVLPLVVQAQFDSFAARVGMEAMGLDDPAASSVDPDLPRANQAAETMPMQDDGSSSTPLLEEAGQPSMTEGTPQVLDPDSPISLAEVNNGDVNQHAIVQLKRQLSRATADEAQKAHAIKMLATSLRAVQGQAKTVEAQNRQLKALAIRLSQQEQAEKEQLKAAVQEQKRNVVADNKRAESQRRILEAEDDKLKAQHAQATAEDEQLKAQHAKDTALQSSNEHLEASNKQLESRVKSLLTENARLESQQLSLKEKNKHLQMQENESQANTRTLESRQKALVEANANLESQQQSLKASNERLQLQAKQSQVDTRTNSANLKAEDEHLLVQEKSLKAENEKLEMQQGSLKAEMERLSSGQTSLKSESEHLQTQISDLKVDVEHLDSQRGSLKAENEGLETQEKSWKAEIERLQTQQSSLKAENAQLVSQTQSLTAEKESLTSQQQHSLQTENAQLKGEEATLQTENAQWKSKEASVEAENNRLRASVKAILQSAQKRTGVLQAELKKAKASAASNASATGTQSALQGQVKSLYQELSSKDAELKALREELQRYKKEKTQVSATSATHLRSGAPHAAPRSQPVKQSQRKKTLLASRNPGKRGHMKGSKAQPKQLKLNKEVDDVPDDDDNDEAGLDDELNSDKPVVLLSQSSRHRTTSGTGNEVSGEDKEEEASHQKILAMEKQIKNMERLGLQKGLLKGQTQAMRKVRQSDDEDEEDEEAPPAPRAQYPSPRAQRPSPQASEDPFDEIAPEDFTPVDIPPVSAAKSSALLDDTDASMDPMDAIAPPPVLKSPSAGARERQSRSSSQDDIAAFVADNPLHHSAPVPSSAGEGQVVSDPIASFVSEASSLQSQPVLDSFPSNNGSGNGGTQDGTDCTTFSLHSKLVGNLDHFKALLGC